MVEPVEAGSWLGRSLLGEYSRGKLVRLAGLRRNVVVVHWWLYHTWVLNGTSVSALFVVDI